MTSEGLRNSEDDVITAVWINQLCSGKDRIVFVDQLLYKTLEYVSCWDDSLEFI